MEPNLMENKVTVIKPRSRFVTFLVFLCLLLIILVGLFTAYLWFNFRSLERHVFHLRNQAMAQQRINEVTQTSLQNLTQPQEKRARALSEAEYLVKLASLNLDFEGNIPLVINLLNMADQQLAALNDPSLIHVRQTLANNISSLEAAPKLDVAGLILKINAISQQIPNLPVVPTELTKPATDLTSSSSSATAPSVWKRSVDAVGRALTNVVVVRHLDQPVEPLLPPQQQAYLILNIQLKLSQAQWAVLHQQPEIYQQNLQQASAWVKQYFLQKEAITQSVLQQLAELQTIQVKPVLPSISDSLHAIESALNAPTVKNNIPAASSVS